MEYANIHSISLSFHWFKNKTSLFSRLAYLPGKRAQPKMWRCSKWTRHSWKWKPQTGDCHSNSVTIAYGGDKPHPQNCSCSQRLWENSSALSNRTSCLKVLWPRKRAVVRKKAWSKTIIDVKWYVVKLGWNSKQHRRICLQILRAFSERKFDVFIQSND